MSEPQRAAWNCVAHGDVLNASALQKLPSDAASVIGLSAGTVYLLAREVRSNGRLGPAIPIGTGRAGELLCLPPAGEGIRIVLRAESDALARLLQPTEESVSQQVATTLIGNQFGTSQRRVDWLAATLGDDSPPWTRLFVVLQDEAKRRSAEAVQDDRELFLSQLQHASSLDDAALDESVWMAVRGASIGGVRDHVVGQNALDRACRLVATRVGAAVPKHISYVENSSLSLIEQFTRSAHIHRRTVLLQGAWWRQQGGPLLVFRESDQAPVALIPRRRGYVAHVMTAEGEKIVRVNAEFAKTLAGHAEMLYAPLPARVLKLRDIVSFLLRGNIPDAMVVVLVMVLAGLLTALIPILTGLIIDRVIPEVAINSLLFIGALLVGIATSQALLHVAAGFAFLRFETRSSFSVMAAFVDRLLQLPASFYRGRNAGDLTQRVMAIEKVRAVFSQSVLSVLVTFVAGFSNLAVLFLYDSSMAWWGVGLACLQMVLVVGVSVYSARCNYLLSVEKGKLDGMSLDLITGIRQARVQGSLARVLSQILTKLTSVGQESYRLGISTAVNHVMLSVFKSVAMVVVFLVFVSQLDAGGSSVMSDGDFIAFVTALGAFFAAMASMGPAISAVAEAIPQYHRLKPIMQTVPEVSEAGRDSHKLCGDVSVRDVVFRYAPELPAVLDGVSIEVRRGEFVAIVGRTGCGKSTLLRLMLGLEVPESGTVLYDGTPMENLDPTVVRSQLGVVMQSTSMLPGNIQTTILGIGSQRTIDDAWAAAELVGMTDEIDAMPMGMSTMVGPGSLSGAQSQRLLIARALVGKPEVLFLDEATSALDNTTQRQIAESIEGLAGTRVAIAHRLSTIREADRIYVLQEGKVVQCGTYDDLVAVDGHFTDLMAGQLV